MPAGQGLAALQPPIDAAAGAAPCVQAGGLVSEDCTRLRYFTLVYQDGLNLWDADSRIHWHYSDGVSKVLEGKGRMVDITPECPVCDDSYDLGDRGVSYHAEPMHVRLRDAGTGGLPDGVPLEADSDLNAALFPSGLWLLRDDEDAASADGLAPPRDVTAMPVLRAIEGEEVVVGVVEPGGRARQRAFVTISQDYDDLFPGFGFPHAALMAPGKGLDAALSHPVRQGCYLWYDGPTYHRANGTWGLFDVVPQGDAENQPFATPDVTSCRPLAVR